MSLQPESQNDCVFQRTSITHKNTENPHFHAYTHALPLLPTQTHTNAHAVFCLFIKSGECQSQQNPTPDYPKPSLGRDFRLTADWDIGNLGNPSLRVTSLMTARLATLRVCQSYCRRLPRLVVSSPRHSEHRADITMCRCDLCVRGRGRDEAGREGEKKNIFQKKKPDFRK